MYNLLDVAETTNNPSKRRSGSVIVINNIYINGKDLSEIDLKNLNNQYPQITFKSENNLVNNTKSIIKEQSNTKLFLTSNWKEYILTKDYSKDYLNQMIVKYGLFFTKEKYTSKEIYTIITENIQTINQNDRLIKLIRLILNYCEEEEIFTDSMIITIRKKIKNRKSGVDNYVPTTKEIKSTLESLNPNTKNLFLMYLASGIRKTEGNYFLKNISSLKCQEFDNFVKISMNYLRKNKNSYFCYLPKGLFQKLQEICEKTTIISLEQEIKRKKLIPIKYCRKWFYTKCVDLGIADTIADYYQGRSANSVGSNHYLSRQMLADKNYSKMVSYLKGFSS